MKLRKMALLASVLVSCSPFISVIDTSQELNRATELYITQEENILNRTSIKLSEVAPVQLSEETIKPVTKAEDIKSALTFYDVPFDAEMQEYIQRTAGNYGIAYKLVLSVIMTESSCKSEMIGDNGNSVGLMQIQPRWWQAEIDYWKLNIYEPTDNVRLGVMILSQCLLENDGDVKRALKQYNSGNPDYPSDKYYNKVMENMNNLKEVREIDCE